MRKVLFSILILVGLVGSSQLTPNPKSGFYELRTEFDREMAIGTLELYDYSIESHDPIRATGMISHLVKDFAPVEISFKVIEREGFLLFTAFKITGSTPAQTRLKDLPKKHRERWIKIISEELEPLVLELNNS